MGSSNINIPHARFDLDDFMANLSENGFDVHNNGGAHDTDFKHGEVYRFFNGQCQLLGKKGTVLTCSAGVFFKTLKDVEKQFNYQLFG